jgi:hypothetical protein
MNKHTKCETNMLKENNVKNANLVSRKNICNQLLISLDRLSGPCPHRRAKETKAATCRHYLP